MKSPTTTFRVLTALLATGAITLDAGAQTRTKADNTNSLNLASSYVENTTIPNSTITVIVDDTLTTSRTSALGGNLSVLGINMNASANRTFQISPTTNATLTIFGGGINKGTNTSALIFNNSVTLGAPQTWTINASSGTGTGNLQMNGAFNDAGHTLNVTGGGTFDLRGSNTFGSNVTIGSTSVNINSAAAIVTFGGSNTFDSLLINAGRLRGATIGNYGTSSNFGDGGTSSTITLGGNAVNGTMEFTGNSASTNRTFTLETRSLGSGIEVSTPGQTLTINSNLLYTGTQVVNTTWNFGGAGNLGITGVIGETSNATLTAGISKTGDGVLTLSGNNTYAGGTQVTAGTLLVNNTAGSGTGTGAVSIAAGATLGGNGTIGGALTINGTLAPGNSIGTLSVNNTVTWNDNDAWKFELGTAGVSMLSSGSSDLLNITGSFTKGTGTSFTFDFLGTGEAGWYKIADWTVGTTFTNTDFVATNLAGGLEGSFVVDAGTSALYLTVVPEPATWAMLVAAGAAFAAVRRRRRQS